MPERCAPSRSKPSTASSDQPLAHHDLEVLVTSAGETHQRGLPGPVARDRRKLGDGVRGLERRDDALRPRQQRERVKRLAGGARRVAYATRSGDRGVLGTVSLIVELF